MSDVVSDDPVTSYTVDIEGSRITVELDDRDYVEVTVTSDGKDRFIILSKVEAKAVCIGAVAILRRDG